MSDSNTSSFETNDECNDQVWTSGGSSESTQVTDASYDYNNAVFLENRPSGHVIRDDSLFKYLGHGAPDASGAVAANPNVALGNHHETAVGSSLSDTQAFTKSCYESSWTEYRRLQAHGPNPYPAAQATTAQGFRGLEYSAGVAWALPHAPTDFSLSERDITTSKQGNRLDAPSYQATPATFIQGNAATFPSGPNQSDVLPSQLESRAGSQRSSSSSGQSGKLLLPPMQGQSKRQRTTSTDETTAPRYRCPKCLETFTRAEGVDRHDGTKHSSGPYWCCNLCTSWQNEVREDNMRAHCRAKHREHIEYDLATNEDVYPYRLVETIDDRDRIDRNSTPGKRTRRRR